MSDVDVLFRTYPARISAVEALLEASKPRSAHADAVRRMGVDFLQGYAISRPKPLMVAA